MKIEFRCDECDRLLRVADTHVGKEIACPACESALIVPDPESDEWATHVDTLGIEARPAQVWSPRTASLTAILRDTWALYVQNLGKLLVVTLIDLLLWLIGIVLIFVPAIGTFAVLQQAVGIPVPLSVLGMFLVMFIGFMYLVNSMTCSQALFFLKVARGQSTSINDAFHIGGGKGKITILPTLFAALTAVGLLMVVIPGILIYLFFWPYIWVWADRQSGDRDSRAFTLAESLSNRNIRTSLAITVIGLAMTFGGLSFFGYSLFGMLKAVAYLHMTGQEVTGLARKPLWTDQTFEDDPEA